MDTEVVPTSNDKSLPDLPAEIRIKIYDLVMRYRSPCIDPEYVRL
jgi:hypothetical protein